MRSADDRSYYSSRARQERERALASGDSAAALAHNQMAAEYERRAEGHPGTAGQILA